MITVIGNAPVDLIAHVTDEFLRQHGLAKGVCTTITAEQQAALLQATSYDVVPGGCGGNVAASLAMLGAPVQFIGAYGEDPYGAIALKALKDLGIRCYEKAQNSSTQLVFIFLTPDGDRSFAAYYDDTTDLPVSELVDFITNRPDGPLLLDGYKLLYPRYRESIVRFITETVHDSVQFVFCPNDLSVINETPDAVTSLHKRSTHIVMNYAEARALTGIEDIEEAMGSLQNDTKQGVITNGEFGAYLFDSSRVIHIPSHLDATHFIDSNGAGDAFAAGYVYGLVNGLSLEEQGVMGARCAAAVLSTAGARPPVDLHARIFEKAA